MIIAIETPGRAKDGKRYTMRGTEVPWKGFDEEVEKAKKSGIRSIGIGDGGNEIGMGNVRELVEKYVPLGEKIASITQTDHLITAAVSNWGAYALMAIASRESKKDLLKDFDQSELLKEIVDLGLIDGVKKEGTLSVDGMELEFHEKILEAIRAFYKYL